MVGLNVNEDNHELKREQGARATNNHLKKLYSWKYGEHLKIERYIAVQALCASGRG